jgi:hypothetical protein
MPTVSGTVHFDAQKAPLTHLYARRKDSDEGPVVALLFSDHPIAERVMADRQKLTDLARRGAFLGLYVELTDSGAVFQTDLLYKEGAFSGPWRFEPASGNTNNAAGRIATESERDFFGKIYAVDISFKLTGKLDETWRGSPFYETKPTGLALGRADGWMERLGAKTNLSHALAVVETDLFGASDERKLFLTSAPIPEEMLQASLGPEQGMHKAGVTFLRVGIDGKGEIQSVMVPSEDGNPINFSSTSWDLELATATDKEVDGRVQLISSVDESPEFPRFDVRFHAPTRSIGAAAPVTAENGKPLPKNGGDPGKAYLDFNQALKKAKTVEELLPLRIASMAKMIDDVPAEHRGEMLNFFKQQADVPVKIVGGFANDQQATLWTESEQDGSRMEGRVNVHREDGKWKLGMESFRIGPTAQ